MKARGFNQLLDVIDDRLARLAGLDAPPSVVFLTLRPRSPSGTGRFEDVPAGIEAGRKAGAAVLAVTSTHDAPELSAADMLVPSLDCVTAIPKPDGVAVEICSPLR